MAPKAPILCGVVLVVLTWANGTAIHATPVAPVGPIHFDAALASAVANLATPGGQQFDYDVGVVFSQAHVDTMRRCASGPDALGKFVLAMRLAVDGGVEEALVRPETAATQCVRDAVLHGQFPAPARASYWVRMEFEVAP